MYTIAAAKTLHEILNEEISPQRVEKVVMELALSPRKKVTGEFINSSGKWTISTPIKCYKHYFNTRALPEIPVASITNAG